MTAILRRTINTPQLQANAGSFVFRSLGNQKFWSKMQPHQSHNQQRTIRIFSVTPAQPNRNDEILVQVSPLQLHSKMDFIGQIVQFEHKGTIRKGIVRQFKNGGWFSIQMPVDGEYPSDPIRELSYTGEIVNKRRQQITFVHLDSKISQEQISTTTITDTTKALEHPFENTIKTMTDPEISKSLLSEQESAVSQDKNHLHIHKIPPPTTIVNLDATLRCFSDTPENKKDRHYYMDQCAHFAAYTKWIVFTDLHCSSTTLSTSLDVLRTVFHNAKQRQAGVLFLGDFWHHRGTVRVDILNAVLHALSDWDRMDVPMIMIPGNHDQVTLGGLEHALTPLQNAYFLDIPKKNISVPGILVFSQPTIFSRALFIPHIRDVTIMQSILSSIDPRYPKNTVADDVPVIQTILCHVDVTGAIMNDNILSTGGVAPSYFPPNIPVYSGHFHKPHRVDCSSNIIIRYVGSPYETTLSEARQRKSLLVLDSEQGWECVEEIPLRLGKRHFRLQSVEEFLGLPIKKSKHDSDDDGVIAGDRIVLSVEQEEIEDTRRKNVAMASGMSQSDRWSKNNHVLTTFDQKLKDLRALGVSVELREIKSLANYPMINLASAANKLEARLLDPSNGNDTMKNHFMDWLSLEEMSPKATLTSFLYHDVQRGAMKNITASTLLDAGIKLLDEIEKEGGENTRSEIVNGVNNGATELCLDTIIIQGFGPFKEVVTYPLKSRGLVLLRGSNKDGGSFDSNGSGKTSLAMSALWTLTGSVDPRPLEDSKVMDVVNDFSKAARVTVRGTINDLPFAISRSKTTSKGSLTFLLDGKDLTRQSVKETQLIIDEVLGVGPQILSRTIFHGQHTINGLLEATDVKLKEELSLIVPLDIWQKAATMARSKGRALLLQSSEFDGMLSIRNRDLATLTEKCSLAKDKLLARQQQYDLKQDETNRLLQTTIDGNPQNLETSLNMHREQLKAVSIELNKLEKMIQTEIETRDADLNKRRSQVSILSDSVEIAKQRVASIQRQLDRTEVSLSSAREKLRVLGDRWNADDEEAMKICPTCKQPLADKHSHNLVKLSVEESFRTTDETIKGLEATESMNSRAFLLEKEKLDQALDDLKSALEAMRDCEDMWKVKLSTLSFDLQKMRSRQMKHNEEISVLSKKMNQEIEYRAELTRCMDMLMTARSVYDDLKTDMEEMNTTIRNLELEQEILKVQSTTMSTLADVLGPRGVQTFILQNAVFALQVASQSYLDELSDGNLRLNLSFDSGDRIVRNAAVLSQDGTWIQRPMSSLSGGQWRRCSLALSLGFSDLVARRGRLRSSLLVLDEPLTHLDSSGRSSVGRLLRKILQNRPRNESETEVVNPSVIGGLKVTTILIILQDLAAEELEEAFDSIDEVIKTGGVSVVQVDD